MRVLVSLIALIFGAILMTTAQAPADDKPRSDEKKEQPKIRVREPLPNTEETKTYPETVVVRTWLDREKAFVVSVQTRAAVREVKGEPRIDIWAGYGEVTKGSEITHGANVYLVKSVSLGTTHHTCTVEKKPAEKKPAEKKP